MMPEPQMPRASICVGRMLGVPALEPDDLEAHVEGLGVDADALDRAWRRPHAELDVGPLERRSGRARSRQHAVAVTQHELPVGADVDDEQHVVLVVGLLGDEHSHVVGSDEPGLHRQHVQPAARVELLEADRRGFGVDRSLDARHEGGRAEPAHVEAHEEVVHGRVADHDHVVDVAGVEGEALGGLARQPGHFVDHVLLQFGEAGGLVRGVVEARDDVVAPCHLRIHGRLGAEHLAGRE